MCAIAQVINDAFRPQLLNALDNVIEPVNMRFGQQTTVGVHRQIAIETIVALCNPAPDLALFYQTKIFDVRHAHECERIVDLGNADIPRGNTGPFVKERSGVSSIGFPETGGLTLTPHS